MALTLSRVAFCRNRCSYDSADRAGVSGFQYPPNIRLIKVMCGGTFDPIFMVKALEMEAAGLLIAECHPGDCHYIAGNCNKVRPSKNVVANKWATVSEYPRQLQKSGRRYLGMAENERGNQN